MSTHQNHNRVPAGVPTGGEFARGIRAEPTLVAPGSTAAGPDRPRRLIHCDLAERHPDLQVAGLTAEQKRSRVLEIQRPDGIREAYFVPEEFSSGWRVDSFTEDELAQFEPALLQSAIGRPRRRLRGLDFARIPANRRAKVEADLDRPLHWLPPRPDGSPGTIRNEILSGRIVGKEEENGVYFFTRTAIDENSSSATEDYSHKVIGVAKSLYDCLGDD